MPTRRNRASSFELWRSIPRLVLALLIGVHSIDIGVAANAGDRLPSLGSGALAGERSRVVVSTDICGTDPDDFQSIVHLLLYADLLDVEGLISSPYGPGRKEDIVEVIDCYANDHANLRTYSDRYPSPELLKAISKQGETEISPLAGVRRSTKGSDWIIRCAKRDDPRPLHVLVWSGLEDVTQPLHDAPEILPKLRIYWIGGTNKSGARAHISNWSNIIRRFGSSKPIRPTDAGSLVAINRVNGGTRNS